MFHCLTHMPTSWAKVDKFHSRYSNRPTFKHVPIQKLPKQVWNAIIKIPAKNHKVCPMLCVIVFFYWAIDLFSTGLHSLAFWRPTIAPVPERKCWISHISTLSHWGRKRNIWVSTLNIIGSDNGLLPARHQAIIWPNAEILLIGPWG